jgi:hypothetical protein
MTNKEPTYKELKEKILKEVRKWHNKCNEEYPVKLEWDFKF